MNDKLIQSQQRLHDSLFDLYEIGGLELMQAGTRALCISLTLTLEVIWEMPPPTDMGKKHEIE